MTPTELLSDLARRNVQLWKEGDQLRVRAQKGTLTSELRAQIALRKDDLLTLLRQHKSEEPARSLPRIAPDSKNRNEPFPLTPIQQAYWVGRNEEFEMGNVACHAYYEVEAIRLDMERFNRAWQMLIERHDMLRAIVLPDGRQKVLDQVPPYGIETLDLRGRNHQEVSSQLEAIRSRLSHQALPSDRWPLFEIRATRLEDERIRLHFSFDILVTDVWSLQILFREWSILYKNPEAPLAPLDLSFRDYALAEAGLQDSDFCRHSRDYWFSRLETLPPAPDLPLAVSPGSLAQPRFNRRSSRLDPTTWQRLKDRAVKAGLTPSGLLLSAFAEVLTVWSRSPRFSINVTLSNRLPLHPQVNSIVGDFTSLIPLEVDNSRRESFESRAERLQRQLLEDVERRYVNGVEILREMARLQGKTSGAVLPVIFTSLLNHQKGGEKVVPLLWMGQTIYGITQTPQAWLDHQVLEEDGCLIFNWDAVDELFPDQFLDTVFEAYCNFLQRLADDEASWDEMERQLVPPAQLAKIAEANATEAPAAKGLLQDGFLQQSLHRPDHPALVSSERTLSYRELYELANRLGRRLRQMGARPNALVAVVMEKGWEQVAAALAVLQAGAAYLPVDPKLPAERLCYLLEDGEVAFALTTSRLDGRLAWPEQIERLCVDLEEATAEDGFALDPAQKPQDLAYVIYTSGSTGRPKGVMIDHRGAINTINDINSRFSIGPEDRVLALSELHFDLSVYDIFGTLAAGGTIVIPDADATRDPAHWAELIERERITIWNSVPTLMEMLTVYLAGRGEPLPASLRLALLSGDWIPLTLPDQIKRLSDRVQVISLGGATEASIWSILHPIEKVEPEWKSVPYGKPMANQRFYVLNEVLEPCPVWVSGQLYIAGAGLAVGYWRDRRKTEAGFITHPDTGERLYRTGDLGRYLPDGSIEFLGRQDFQVKVQGYRIELGEIEAVILQHAGVRSAAVTAAENSQGKKRLVAYVVPEREAAVDADELKRFLEKKLPAYMVPSSFVMMDALPLTSNGKVDRKSLPAPTHRASMQSRTQDRGASDIERRIADTVAQVLKVNRVDSEANLLDLGANSVDIVRIALRLEKEFGFRPQIRELYDFATVKQMAASFHQSLSENRAASPDNERAAQTGSSLDRFELLTDPAERERFKRLQPGLRPQQADEPRFALTTSAPDEELINAYVERITHRRFAQSPVSSSRFCDFISCLRQFVIDGKPRYLYGSAGGLYPVQVYLHVKAGRVEGLPGGTYYYHPADDALALLSHGAELDRTIHEPFVNRSIFDEAAFSIFLICRLAAIAPMYGERSLHFAAIEAGLMSQLLEMSAPANQIGLCQIGDLDFERIRHLFDLEENHVLIHSLLGGAIDADRRARGPSSLVANYSFADCFNEYEEGEL